MANVFRLIWWFVGHEFQRFNAAELFTALFQQKANCELVECSFQPNELTILKLHFAIQEQLLVS